MTKKSKGAGLETWYYGYDTLNRLTSVEQTSNGTALLLTATYTFDVLGHRLEEDDWQTGGVTTVTKTAYDGDAAWADLNGSNVVQTRYLAGPGVNQWLARIDGSGDDWLLTDRLGSVRDVVGSAGTLVMDHAEYQAFGGVASDTSAAAAGALGFDGERQDRNTGEIFAAGLVDNTLTHQWQQENPDQFGCGDDNLRQLVGNDPMNASDPCGAMPDDLTFDYGKISGTLQGSTTTTKAIDASVNGKNLHGKVTAGAYANITQDFDGLSLDRGKGIYLAYEGDMATSVKWIQFFRIRIEAHGMYVGEAHLPAVVDGFVTETANTDEAFGTLSTSTTQNPIYYVDSHSKTEPYYTSSNSQQQAGLGGVAKPSTFNMGPFDVS